jgi:nucleotide-binding universal stress UspA family protein
MIRRILFPTDFSPCADHALETALELREKLQAELVVLHVWEMPQGLGIESFPYFLSMGGEKLSLMDAVRGQAEKAMDELMGRLKKRGITLESRLRPGAAPWTIVEESKDFDLIVMGTHGRGLVMHFLLGSVAERVVRKSKVAVLTVRSEV